MFSYTYAKDLEQKRHAIFGILQSPRVGQKTKDSPDQEGYGYVK